ncbi:MAG: hypothetical protein GWM92_08625 [Gemmatimonadetes bacterium]|nr:hypothetical protein [Gemmatimonadota bacterium]NIR78700.1 hypothetical protein [Gemmatimonadota bacterium]NIT87339.1 hypothetical protein [Gemmatimonadota bacterium]NIU31183.1 hypothetical protein [Gemmatimonadota bacterium]NIU35905.1 hypothetical protein [Gemmatimonadota bacterium]
MSPQWRRRAAEWRETLGAAALGAGVGVATFYLVRIFLARDEVSGSERRSEPPATEPPEDPAREEP